MTVIQEAPSFVVGAPGIGGVESIPGIKKQPSPDYWEAFFALHNFRQEISPDGAIFNTASLRTPEISGTIFISRAVNKSHIRAGEPDRNSLHVCVTDPSGKRRRLKDLEPPINERIVNWEDLRVGIDRTVGSTVVLYEGNEYNPHPALFNVGIEDGNLIVVGTPKIFENLRGKNVIPLENGIIYRPDGVSHQLHYIDSQGELLEVIDFSNFKHIEWLSKKMGATARPIDLEDGLKLLLIHGIRKGQGIDGTIKDDIYAIGIAVLDEMWHVKAVDNKPLLERKDFLGNLRLEEDLNPKKEVVYLCDVQEEGEDLILPVNVGDRITVFMRIPFTQLRDRAKNLLLEQ